jgi:5-methylcytosine-specific restriction protein A
VNIPTPEKRKPLTPLQRAAMFDAHKGICCICGCKIHAGEKWIDEHRKALGMLGTNDMSNRGPAHVACAREKTKDDVSMIAKAKRIRAKHLGCWKSQGPKIRSRGFQKRGMDPDT